MMNALIRFNSVGISFVILFILLSQFQIRPASGLECFECTSEDPGCDKKVWSTPALKKECGADAIGCGIYAVYYDFFIGAIFHRSCFYSYDLYNETTDKGWLDLDRDGYDTSFSYEDYKETLDFWNKERKAVHPSAPSVIAVKHFPIGISGHFGLRVFLEDFGLTNGDEFSKWTWPGVTREETPSKNTIECYSCEFEIKGTRIYADHRAPTDSAINFEFALHDWNLPPCGSKDPSKLKKVTCKNAYGCATFLEMKNASKAMDTNFTPRKDINNNVARVWRGCWYPGEQKCLRDPESMIKPAERSLKSLKEKKRTGGARQTDTQTADCDKAYKRSFDTGKGAVIWAGVKPIESSDEYNKYLECRHNVRLGVNAESQLKLVTDKVDKEYIWIQYQFCGPKSKCNRYIEVDTDAIGKAKYNPKDYEDLEGKVDDKKKKNVTKLDKCDTESGEDEKNASAVLIRFDKILNVFLLTFIFLLH